MSLTSKHLTVAAAAVAACIVLGTLMPVMSRAEVREIHLVARGMAFYLQDDPRTPNPTIEARAGETIRVILHNEERGVTHDFASPALSASTERLAWNERAHVTFTVPREAGTFEYICNPHRLMMRGVIRVTRN